MTIFYDDFERANGAPGNGWVVRSGSFAISNGSISGSSGVGVQENYSTGGYIEAAIHHYLPSAGGTGTGLLIHAGVSSGAALWIGVLFVAGTWVFRVVNGYHGTGNLVASVDLPAYPGPYQKLAASWEAGHVKAWLNDALLIETDTEYASNSVYAGIDASGTTTSVVTDFRLVTDAAVDLVVTPNPVGNFGDPVSMTAVGTGTAWTAGTPGAPVLGVTVGTISDQVVADATHMTFTWTIGNFLGAAIFTDPTSGETDTVLVSSNPTYLPGPLCPFTDEAVAMVNNSAPDNLLGQLLTPLTDISVGEATLSVDTLLGNMSLQTSASVGQNVEGYPSGGLLPLLWKILNNNNEQGTYAWTPSRDTSLKEDLESLVNEWVLVRGDNEHTFQTIIDQLLGYPGATLQDVYTLVQGLAAPDLQPVLDAIAAMRGDEIATLSAIAAQLDAIRSIGDYTLASVRTWVEAVRGTDQPTIHDVLDAIAALNNAPATDLAPVLSAVGGVDTVVDLIIAALTAFLVPELSTVGTILDAIDAIEVPEAASGGAPVWPGLANVTLGEPVALGDGVVVTGPMHGLLLNVTGHPSGSGKFAFGSIRSWRYLGAVLFVSDNGDAEWPSQIGPEQQVIAPRHMAMAASAVFRLNAGFTGTVTPWLVAGGA